MRSDRSALLSGDDAETTIAYFPDDGCLALSSVALTCVMFCSRDFFFGVLSLFESMTWSELGLFPLPFGERAR